MRSFALITALLLVFASAYTQDIFNNCGMYGSATRADLMHLDSLKNRWVAPIAIDSTITLSRVLTPGDDHTRFSSYAGATVIGYCVEVKPGGVESCNCGALDLINRDAHIIITPDAQHLGAKDRMIVETTPRMRAQMLAKGIDWSTPTLMKNMVNHYVVITGWMFFDGEHTNASENTHPGGIHNWRGSAWEIHPITNIQIK